MAKDKSESKKLVRQAILKESIAKLVFASGFSEVEEDCLETLSDLFTELVSQISADTMGEAQKGGWEIY